MADYYSNRENAWEAYSNLYDAISKHSDERKYFIYKCILYKKASKTWKETNKTFHCKINENSNELLLDDLNRHLYVNIICYKKSHSKQSY